MASQQQLISESEWEKHKDKIIMLYIAADLDLQDTMEIMETRFGFARPKSQYLAHLLKWGLKKNATALEWKFVAHQKRKRERNNKATKIFKNGLVIPDKTVQKEISRNCSITLSSRFGQRSPSPRPPDMMILQCRTPSPPPQCDWSTNLPWFIFRQTILQGLVKSYDISKFAFGAILGVADALYLCRGNEFLRNAASGLQQFLPGPAISATGNSVFLEAVFYGITNHHIRSYDNNERAIIKSLLQHSEEAKVLLNKLRESKAYSIEALLDALFTASIQDMDVDAVEFLLCTGANKYKEINFHARGTHYPRKYLPIEAAILSGSRKMAQLLHQFDAKIPETVQERFTTGRKLSILSSPYIYQGPLNNIKLLSMYCELDIYALCKAAVDVVQDGVAFPLNLHKILCLISARCNVELVLAHFFGSDKRLLRGIYAQADFAEETPASRVLAKLDDAYQGVTDDNDGRIGRYEEDFDISTDSSFIAMDKKIAQIITRWAEDGTIMPLPSKTNHMYGENALAVAASLGLFHVVLGLSSLATVEDLNGELDKNTPLKMTLSARKIQMASLLIDAGARPDGQDVLVALHLGLEETLQRCASFNYDSFFNKRNGPSYWKYLTPSAAAFLYGSPTFPYQRLIKHPSGYDPSVLMAAVHRFVHAKCDRAVIQSLVQRRPVDWSTKNPHEGTALVIAAKAGDEETFSLLLSSGIGPRTASNCFDEIPDKLDTKYQDFLSSCSQYFRQTLKLVVQYGSSSMVKALLEVGFLPDDIILKTAVLDKIKQPGTRDVLLQYMRDNDASNFRALRIIPLIWAVQQEDTALVRQILTGDVDVNYHHQTIYNCALGYAVERKNLENIELLLAKGAKIDRCVLRKAKDAAVQKALSRHATNNNLFALMEAIIGEDTERVRKLLAGRVDVNEKVYDQDSSTFSSALSKAIDIGNCEIIRLLRQEGATISYEELRTTPSIDVLLSAFSLLDLVYDGALEGNVHLIKQILDEVKDVNFCLETAPGEEATPLQIAAAQGQFEIAKLLLAHGANCNSPAIGCQRFSRTALEGAAENGRLDMVHFLLAHGTSTEGEERLQYFRAVKFAERECHHAVARLLRDHREWNAEDEELFTNVDLPDFNVTCCRYHIALDFFSDDSCQSVDDDASDSVELQQSADQIATAQIASIVEDEVLDWDLSEPSLTDRLLSETAESEAMRGNIPWSDYQYLDPGRGVVVPMNIAGDSFNEPIEPSVPMDIGSWNGNTHDAIHDWGSASFNAFPDLGFSASFNGHGSAFPGWGASASSNSFPDLGVSTSFNNHDSASSGWEVSNFFNPFPELEGSTSFNNHDSASSGWVVSASFNAFPNLGVSTSFNNHDSEFPELEGSTSFNNHNNVFTD